MLTDGQWTALEPLIETYRPPAEVAPQNLRQTMSAILWRHQNGARWRAVPEVLGLWWKAAQTFIRWSRLGVWERLLILVQKERIELGMTFLDGTDIRAHQKAAGVPRKRIHPHDEMSVRRCASPGAAYSAGHSAVVAGYFKPLPRGAALRRSSRDIVDPTRPSRRPTSRTPGSCIRKIASPPRSANAK